MNQFIPIKIILIRKKMRREWIGDTVFLLLKAYALTLPPIGFALRNVQIHISKQFRVEMCVCTLLKANPIGRKVRAYVFEGKENFTG